jgi:signal transduction histidine kinase/outer membrane protein assembly factor BamB
MTTNRVLLLLSFFLTIQRGYTQTGYTVRHYNSENGLPQNSVKSISADTEGFIWLATEEGLVRFDGRRFSVFNRNNLSVESNRMYHIVPSLREVAKSGLPLYTGRSQISHGYFENHEAVRVENGIAVRDTATEQYVEEQMLSIHNGRERVGYIPGLPDRNISQNVSEWYIFASGTGRGDFYLSDSTGVSYYRQFKKQYHTAARVPRIWNYFSVDDKLYYFHEQNFFTKISNAHVTQFALCGDIIHDPLYGTPRGDIKLYWNHNSAQAFLSLRNNIYALDPNREGDLVTRLLISDFEVNTFGIETIYEDRSTGNVFLGSVSNGLYVASRRQFRGLVVDGGTDPNIFYAHIPYDAGAIVTPTGIVTGLNPATGQAFQKRLPLLESINPSDKRVILRDRNGTLWVKKNEDLFHLDTEAKKILGKWRAKGEIKTICQGQDGTIWFGAVDDYLYALNPEKLERGLVETRLDSFPTITALVSLDAGHLLAGTVSGLYRIDLNTRKAKRIDGSHGVGIKSIHIQHDNKVWITAQEKGVMLLDAKGALTAFPLDKNRYLASAHCAIDDGNGYLWVPTNRGLFQMATKDLLSYAKLKQEAGRSESAARENKKLPVTLFYVYRTMEEGFNTNEFNGSCQPCGLILPNGYISLPSLNGLVWFQPEKIRAQWPQGNVVLDRVYVNGLGIPLKGDSIHFPIAPEDIRVHFAIAYFGNEYNLDLTYALQKEGKAEDTIRWIPMEGSDFTVRYSSLDPGDYTLLLKKKNGFGIGNEVVKKLYLFVPPKWYETNTARVLLAFIFTILFLLVVYYYGQYRLAASERENRRLERIVKKRTASLDQALQVVEKSKDDMAQQIHIFSRLVASISHDVQSPLKYISFASQKLPDMIEMNQLDKASSLGRTIFDLSDRMSTLLVDLLDFLKVSVYQKRMDFENINLGKLVDNKLELFKNVVARNNSRFINEVSSDQTVFSSYQFLSIVIHNLIDNAGKYTYNGEVRIYMKTDTEYKAELIISNTGRGIPLQMIEMINSPIDNDNLGNLMDSGRTTGLGLLIVKEVGEMAGITIKVTQTDVTSFHLCFR